MTEAPAPLVIDGPCGLTVDTSCIDAAEWDDASPTDHERALDSARRLLNMLTAGLVANCPVDLRPCRESSCLSAGNWYWSGSRWTPVINDYGQWINTSGCSCDGPCSHDPATSLRLPTLVAEVVEVTVDGAVLPTSAYRVSGRWLLRTDGQPWPDTQDMDALPGQDGTFVVTYRPGAPLGPMGEAALGRLVQEFLRSCTGGKCALPAGVRTLSRQGAQYNVEADPMSDMVLGIREVDFYTATINPNRLKQPSRVYVPGGL